jgi:1-acyl-sn-glycerol-3-phosphate acyltransferase
MSRRIIMSLNRVWRIVGTGLSFAVFGFGAVVLGVIVCPAMRIIIHDSDAYSQAARRLVSRSFLRFIGFMSRVGVLRWSVDGLSHWQRDRVYLVVANHPTLIDIVFLLALFEGADCLVKAGVLRNRFWGILVRSADYVSNEDMAVLLREAAARLRAGRTVVMFPEGTRAVPGRPHAFGAAAGVIAVRAGCPCLPVVITCTPPTLYKGLPWYRVPARRVDFRLRLYAPIAVPEVPGTPAEQRRAARAHNGTLAAFFDRELAGADSSGVAIDPERGVFSNL